MAHREETRATRVVMVAALTDRLVRAGALALSALMLAEVATAQQVRPMPPCRAESFRGRVVAGESLEISMTPSLLFRLDADTSTGSAPGWTIRVTPANAPDDDYSMVATPPFRFANPRYVDTGYGITAEQALANTPRAFAFVATRGDYTRARAAMETLLWAYGYSTAQLESAASVMGALPAYPATFLIEAGETSPPNTTHELGRIEWMSFRLDVCLPMS